MWSRWVVCARLFLAGLLWLIVHGFVTLKLNLFTYLCCIYYVFLYIYHIYIYLLRSYIAGEEMDCDELSGTWHPSLEERAPRIETYF